MKIILSADSACDMTAEQKKECGLNVIPFSVIMGDKEYKDGVNVFPQDLYDYVKSTGKLPKTSAVNAFEFEEYFKTLLKSADHIIHFSISSGLSATCGNCQIAANNVDPEHIHVIDSKSLSSGIALLVLAANDEIKKKQPLEKILESINFNIEHDQTSFMINNLKFLYKGGRCSSLALLGANLLRIKPKIKMNDGKLGMAKKYMGKYEDTLKKYADELFEEHKNLNLDRAFVTYSSVMPVREEFMKLLKNKGFKDVQMCDASATICCHCGPDTIGILFLTK